jgi:farnesyl-diphosphate farnesyltransferase
MRLSGRNRILTFPAIRCFMLAMSDANQALLGDLLKATSRSFYLTLRVLPAAVRPQIGLAYLLARTTDTIADTELIPLAQRLEALQNCANAFSARSFCAAEFRRAGAAARFAGGKILLEKVEAGLALLSKLSPADLTLVREVLSTITAGRNWTCGGSGLGPAPPARKS